MAFYWSPRQALNFAIVQPYSNWWGQRSLSAGIPHDGQLFESRLLRIGEVRSRSGASSTRLYSTCTLQPRRPPVPRDFGTEVDRGGSKLSIFGPVESPHIPARVTESHADPSAGNRFEAGASLTVGLRPTTASSIQIDAQTILIDSLQRISKHKPAFERRRFDFPWSTPVPRLAHSFDRASVGKKTRSTKKCAASFPVRPGHAATACCIVEAKVV
jgi:hypothetical protein